MYKAVLVLTIVMYILHDEKVAYTETLAPSMKKFEKLILRKL